jgi:arginyl-tRNA synthetase
MQQIEELINNLVKSLYDVEVATKLTRTDEKFGDFTSNVALQLASKLPNPPADGPRAIAQQIVDNLAHESIAKAEVAGPGFINLTLSDQALAMLTRQPLALQRQDSTVVIETNNPNPFKAMHIGHAFNAIIADTIANLLEASGAHTYRVSYHGDVGLHVGKSMYSLLKFVDGDVGRLADVAEDERNVFMARMYAEGARAYKENEAAKAEIESLAKQSFTRGDAVYAQVYETVFDWSFEQIDSMVARLGNKPTSQRFLESDAELRGVKIVKDNVPKVFQESDGALMFKGSDYGSFDNVFVGKNGNGLYAARDLGLMQLKNEQYHPHRSYIVTAEEQRAYFVGVIAAAELCIPAMHGQTLNITTGTVKLASGKMSSRDGDVLDIAWLFHQVAEAIKARGGEPDDQLVAGVLRYEFLKVRIGGDVVFDINEAVSLQGNSGPYLQYAHARARSILLKGHVDAGQDWQQQQLEKDERTLVRKIGEYAEVADLAIGELMPHHVANYLYELAQTFNRFYEGNRVIGDARQSQRLGLVAAYANTLKCGMELLGMHAPDVM